METVQGVDAVAGVAKAIAEKSDRLGRIRDVLEIQSESELMTVRIWGRSQSRREVDSMIYRDAFGGGVVDAIDRSLREILSAEAARLEAEIRSDVLSAPVRIMEGVAEAMKGAGQGTASE